MVNELSEPNQPINSVNSINSINLINQSGSENRILNFIIEVLKASWLLLLDASIYILFGLVVSGFLRVFLNPNSVVRHLGRGRFSSVFKAAFLGIPIPL
jgi:uncharacterized membrane protein YraQ (UPF0718 family)